MAWCVYNIVRHPLCLCGADISTLTFAEFYYYCLGLAALLDYV